MEKLDQIRNEYAFQLQYPDWDVFISEQPIHKREEHYNNVTKQYAEKCCQASLLKASENAISDTYKDEPVKESIKNPSNIVLL